MALFQAGQRLFEIGTKSIGARLSASAWVVVAFSSIVSAVDLELSPADIERALKLSRAEPAVRRAFHQPYLIQVRNPTITRVEVITELRRMVLLAEEHISHGDVLFTRGTRDATDAIKPWRGRLSVVVSVKVDPRNVYVLAPPIDILLTGRLGDVLRVRQRSKTVFGDGPPGSRLPVLGAEAEAEFMAMPLAQSAATLVVSVDGRERSRTPIDFRTLQ